MKKLLKMFALSLALALTMGMIVFAADSVSGGDSGSVSGGDSGSVSGGDSGSVSGGDSGSTTDPDNDDKLTSETENVEVSEASKSYDASTLKTELSTALSSDANALTAALPDGYTSLDLSKGNVSVVASFDLKGDNFAGGNVVISGVSGLSASKIYIAVHYHDGSKLFHKVTVSGDKITIYNVNSFSDFVIVDVTDVVLTGEDSSSSNNSTNNNNNSNGSSNTATTAATTPTVVTSPKTGETVPATVVVSIIGLAALAAVEIRRFVLADKAARTVGKDL